MPQVYTYCLMVVAWLLPLTLDNASYLLWHLYSCTKYVNSFLLVSLCVCTVQPSVSWLLINHSFFTGVLCIIKGFSEPTPIMCSHTMAYRVVYAEATEFSSHDTWWTTFTPFQCEVSTDLLHFQKKNPCDKPTSNFSICFTKKDYNLKSSTLRLTSYTVLITNICDYLGIKVFCISNI